MKDSVSNADEIEPTGGPDTNDVGDPDSTATSGASGAEPEAAEPGVAEVEAAEPGMAELEMAADLEDLDRFADGSGDQLDAELLALREEFEDLNDRHLRLAAEFNNYRRRVDAERVDLWSRAQADLVGKVLDVVDDLHRVAGLDLTNATVENIMEGIDLVDRKFVRILGDLGVEIVDPEGERFDPETMEAMMRVPAESEEDDERVAQVFQKGYALKGVLIRPARVSVHKHG